MNSPSQAVRKARPMRPTVIPAQKPVEVREEEKVVPERTWVMNVTIQPPSDTMMTVNISKFGDMEKREITFSSYIAKDESCEYPSQLIT